MYRRIPTVRKLLSAVRARPAPGSPGESRGTAARRPFTAEAGPTVVQVIEQWSRRFENEGIPDPVESIEHILSHVTGRSKEAFLDTSRNERLTAAQTEKLELLCECRLSRMPVQYIIGEWDFRDITLKLVPPVFIPRPETEILVDLVLKRLNDASPGRKQEILEVGCGSGAISLAIGHSCKQARCTAIDTSLHACELTKENRDKLDLRDRVAVAHASLTEDGTIGNSVPLNGHESVELGSRHFDFIVSNPPYVRTNQIPRLAAEIKIYEDIRALDGGDDGLKIIKPLLKYAATSLKPGGRLLLEVDPSHPEYISFFTKKYPMLKLRHEHTYKDFCNKDRFVEVLKT